jgi:hypothetical protein
MNRKRAWLELITVCAIAAVILALGLAVIGSSAAVTWSDKPQAGTNDTQGSSGPTKFTGVISDSICKGKHDRSTNQSAFACTEVCLKKGAQYVLVDGEHVYALKGATEYLDKFAGERVTITGSLSGETIQVASVDGGRQ